MYRPDVSIEGAVELSAISAVEGVQPFGAVGPMHVSRKKICVAILVESEVAAGTPDSKTINRPSPLMDGRPLLPDSNDPSGAMEISAVLGMQPPGASIPS